MVKLLGFIKPDAVVRANIGRRVLGRVITEGKTRPLSFQRIHIDKNLLDQHYHHVTTRAFYPWLVQYITASPSYVMVMEADDNGGIERIRDLLGSTLSHKAADGTVRAECGVYAGINCLHISDSVESAQTELALWSDVVKLQEGKFDMNVADYVGGFNPGAVNHTTEMRAICAAASAAGSLSDADRSRIVTLLREEGPDVSPEHIEGVATAIGGSCFF